MIYSQLLGYNKLANCEKQGETAVFSGKYTIKTVMCDILLLNNVHPEMYTVETV